MRCSVHVNARRQICNQCGWRKVARGYALKSKQGKRCIVILLFKHLSVLVRGTRHLLRFTNEEYRHFKLNYPGSNLPQGVEIFMKCGVDHSTAHTGGTVLGIAHDGYWKNTHVLEQIKIAVKVFEATYPGKQALFLFDSSTGHNNNNNDLSLI